jgi:hypothetical protein
MSTHLIPGMSLVPLSDVAPLSEPHLILHADKLMDLVVVIPSTARHRAGRTYFVGYRRISYKAILEALVIGAPQLVQEPFTARPSSCLADEDLNKKYRRPGQSESNSLMTLKIRWLMIEPLVTSLDREVLFDKNMLHAEVVRRATELADSSTYQKIFEDSVRSKGKAGEVRNAWSFEKRVQALVAEIKRLLNQYWAGGSARGALINFSSNCGGRGKRKKVSGTALGRKSARTKSGEIDHEPLIISSGGRDEEIIMHCIDHYLVRGVTVAHAVRRMWADFYSESVQLDSGKTVRRFLPPNRRPTRSQFEYRMRLAKPEQAAWRKHLAPNEFERNFRAVMGSATDDVKAVGQRGGIDASPIDFQLVRLTDRLARIGGANRLLLADSLYGYIPGFYLGLESPSSMTVKLAVHHALNPDKSQWLDALGLDQDPDDWIPIHFTNLWADNTDLRSVEVMACLTGIGTNIHYVPVRRADRNPIAESSHHAIHRLVDHKMHGSTFGRSRMERGEESAIDRARHTLIQAIRETARAVHAHNTVELDIARPLWMREQGVPPTRLHMTRATIERGMVARSLCSFETAHMHLLPRHQGTFTSQGVRLHRQDTGNKVCFVEPLVYVSTHQYVVRKVEEARRGGKRDPDYFRATFLIDPYAPRHCWYLDLMTMETIRLDLKIRAISDPELPFEATLHDVVQLMQDDAIEGPVRREAQQQKLAQMEEGQAATKDEADVAYEAALEAADKKPSKAQLRANRTANREAEKASLMYGIPVVVALGSSPPDRVERHGGNAAQSAAKNPIGGNLGIPMTSHEESVTPPISRPPKASFLRAAVEANRKLGGDDVS